jgi:xanthine dehydrogenase large subunit
MSTSKPHESAAFHVSGSAIYTDDQRPIHGLLSCWPVMAPHARAKILKIDVSKAYDVPGVVSVLDPADVLGVNDSSGHHHDEILLPNTEIYYWGQAVTWVIAETEEAARLGAEKVLVEYEKLEPILTIEKAIELNSFHSDTLRIARGDTSAALETSPQVITDEVYVGGQDHFYLETQTSWVIPDGEGHFHVYSSTQHPSETQTVVARVLGIPRNNVVVTSLRMGGGFGGKESQANPYAAIAALAAHKTGRPVRVRLKRDQDMILTGKRHPFLGRYKVGFDDKGKLLALDLDLYSDGGWSSDLSEPVLARAMFHSDNCYYIPNMDVRGRVAKTNKTSQTAFRGFGGPQGMVVIETIFDRVARQLGLAPEIVREKNFYHGTGETSTTHYGQEIIDNRIQRVWDEVKVQSGFDKRRVEIESFNKTSRYKKRGLAITPVKFGISFTHTILNQAGALVLIYTDGSIQVNHGGTEMGQGLHVKMLQVAAKTLGVSFDRFRMMPTATDKVPNTSATAASSGADLNGQAVKNACDILKTRLAEVAAKMLNLNAPEDMAFEDDYIFSSQQPTDRVKFDDVVAQAYLWQVSLFANGYYRTPNIYWDKHKGKGKPFFYYAYGASVSEIEVDGLTGQWKLRQVDIVHDVGESLNPLIDKGQIEGGFVQGMGWLTMEELVWDNEGRLRTHAPSTYKIPTIAEVPEKFSVHLLERASQAGVIYGSKAVGEPPLMLPISVREALRDAVAAFGDVTPSSVPLAAPATPEAILMAIELVRATAKALVPGD